MTLRTSRIFKLEEAPRHCVRVLSSEVRLAAGTKRSWVTITRTGSFTDPRYGRFEITEKMLADMVRNFRANVVGIDICLDVNHKPGDGAAAKVLQLAVENGRLRAEVEWTDYGVDAVRERGFRYLSAEFDENWQDNEQGNAHGCVLLGAGLTIRPVIKRLEPVMLAVPEDHTGPVFILPGLAKQLTESLENADMNRWKKFLAALAAAGITLSDAQIAAFQPAFEAGTKHLAEDADDAPLIAQFVTAAKALAAAPAGSTIQLSVNTTATGTDDINAAVTKALADQAAAAKTLASTRDARVKKFSDAIAAATGLSDETRKTLGEASDLITADMSEDQVTRLATQQIALGNSIESAKQLAAQGFRGVGSAHITLDESNNIRKLSEEIRKHVRGTSAHHVGHLRAVADETKMSPFAQKVLASFDAEHGERLHNEHKALSGGVVNTGDMSLPASYQREVIVETLADLRILELVNADVEITSSATHTIPYETRSTSTVYNDGIVYEGQAIHQAGISQANALSYITPMKIAMELTNEALSFSRFNANINWDAWGRNTASNARLARELISRRLMNEMQRGSDAYQCTTVAAETFDSQLSVGVVSLIKTTNFPIVRPYQPRDLQGNTTGTAENLIVMTLNSVVITAYDGTGTQAAGTYYNVENYNLGLIRLVNELGVAVTPADSGTNTIAYKYATNVVKVDTDVPASPAYYERHMNKLLQAFGARKATLSQDRYTKPNFGLMSEVLHNMVTDAENFSANFQRNGTDLTGGGDLAAIKAVPAYGTNTDADLGDERILIGERGNLFYRIAKTFSIGAPFEVFNSSGKPLGKKGAYGEEYSSILMPSPLRKRFTSVIAYSVTARAAAV